MILIILRTIPSHCPCQWQNAMDHVAAIALWRRICPEGLAGAVFDYRSPRGYFAGLSAGSSVRPCWRCASYQGRTPVPGGSPAPWPSAYRRRPGAELRFIQPQILFDLDADDREKRPHREADGEGNRGHPKRAALARDAGNLVVLQGQPRTPVHCGRRGDDQSAAPASALRSKLAINCRLIICQDRH